MALVMALRSVGRRAEVRWSGTPLVGAIAAPHSLSFAHSAAAGKALRQVQCASPGVQHRAFFCLQGLRHGVICIAPRSSLFPLGEGREAEGRPEQEGKSKKVFGESRTQKSVPEICINDHEWGPHGSPRAHIRSE